MKNISTWPHENYELNPIAQKKSNDLSKIYRMLSTKHRVETIERYIVEGLPDELDKDLIERILYFRFKGAMFKYNDKFYFLPFTLSGEKGIDSYGRYNAITPVLFTGQWVNEDKKDIQFMSGLSFETAYNKTKELGKDYAIVLTDHSLAVSQDEPPMANLIHPVIEQMQDILVLINIDLVTSAKVFYVRVNNDEEKARVEKEFYDLDDRILNGKRVVAVVGDIAWQELQQKSPKDSAKYFQSYQSFDNLRKDLIGIPNGGTFMKQEHTTEMETETNTNSGNLILDNGLRMRQEWADLVNHYYGLNIQWSLAEMESNNMVGEESSQTEQKEGAGDAISE